MLVEMAIGDAYGAAFEFMPPSFIVRENDLANYRRNPETGLGDGRYTDDTQMTIAISEHLIAGEVSDVRTLAGRFVDTFKRDPRRGYSKRLFHTLESADGAQDFLGKITPNSTRSGAAMRASPIGLLPDLTQVLELSAFQASITHDTDAGRMSATAVATMAHYLFYDLGPRQELGRFIERHVPGYAWSEKWSGTVSMEGMDCAHAAISQVTEANGLSSLLRDVVDLGGDTDTVAAIALFSGSIAQDIAQDLPACLYETLEDGPYGKAFLQQLESRLTQAVGKI